MNFPCSGVILAGGQNKRMSGNHKSFIKINGKRIIDSIFEVYKDIFDEIIIVTNTPDKYTEFDALIVTDIIKKPSSLAGLHSGLFYSSNPYIFVSACDTPFLNKELVKFILKNIEPGKNIIIPETQFGMEPLCAAYSKKCLTAVEKNLKENKLIIKQIFKKSRTKIIPENLLKTFDLNLSSFFNINTPKDLSKAKTIV